MTTFTIRKDTFNGTARPWCADFTFADGTVEVACCYNYPTKKALVQHLNIMPGNHQIVRGVDR